MLTGLSTMACKKFGLYLISIVLLLALGGGCATSLLDNPATPREMGAGEGTVVGSFLIEPAPQWTDHPEHFWLLLGKKFPSMKQYSIPLMANQEEYVVKHLPVGKYWVLKLYAGKLGGFMSTSKPQGWDTQAWEFEVQEQQITYIGRLRVTTAKEPDHILALRQSTKDNLGRVMAYATKSHVVSLNTELPKLYVDVAIEDSLQDAVNMLESRGWTRADVTRIVTSLMAPLSAKNK